MSEEFSEEDLEAKYYTIQEEADRLDSELESIREELLEKRGVDEERFQEALDYAEEADDCWHCGCPTKWVVVYRYEHSIGEPGIRVCCESIVVEMEEMESDGELTIVRKEEVYEE